MLPNYLLKIKSYLKVDKSDLFLAAFIFLLSLASFGLGRLSVLWPKKEPITISNESAVVGSTEMPANGQAVPPPLSATVKGKYVASKSGAFYHYPWCPGALRIKEENKIWFQTKAEAEKAGYKPAANCDGL